MYVFKCHDADAYIESISRFGLSNTNIKEFALTFESKAELNFFIPWLDYLLGMDFAYFYSVMEYK